MAKILIKPRGKGQNPSLQLERAYEKKINLKCKFWSRNVIKCGKYNPEIF